jgi:hypothetical protein
MCVAIVVVDPGLITAKIMYVIYNIGAMSEEGRAGQATEKGYHDQLSDGHGHWWWKKWRSILLPPIPSPNTRSTLLLCSRISQTRTRHTNCHQEHRRSSSSSTTCNHITTCTSICNHFAFLLCAPTCSTTFYNLTNWGCYNFEQCI